MYVYLARRTARRLFRVVVLGTAVLGTTAMLAAQALLAPSAAASPVALGAVHAACGPAAANYVRCFAQYQTTGRSAAATRAGTAPDGYGPADLRAAYKLPSATAGAGETVAVVDAYDDPNAEADLAVYRLNYGLSACTSANGCFRKVDQTGGQHLPASNFGWAVEISLDIQMISAACPNCHILLVEGDSASVASLANAENTAVRLGANVVSNSYGLPENFGGARQYAPYYTHRGVAITVSSGDSGFGPAQFPADLTSVTSVGGTSLHRDPSTARGWTESAWSGAGSGCSAYITKPSWQHDKHCHMRTVADVSAVADQTTGLAIYDSFELPGWLRVGGTSAAAPLIASIYALAGNTRAINNAGGLYRAAARRHLNDVVGGSTGFCGGDYLCTGLPGYDAPTGNGTPAGTGAF